MLLRVYLIAVDTIPGMPYHDLRVHDQARTTVHAKHKRTRVSHVFFPALAALDGEEVAVVGSMFDVEYCAGRWTRQPVRSQNGVRGTLLFEETGLVLHGRGVCSPAKMSGVYCIMHVRTRARWTIYFFVCEGTADLSQRCEGAGLRVPFVDFLQRRPLSLFDIDFVVTDSSNDVSRRLLPYNIIGF